MNKEHKTLILILTLVLAFSTTAIAKHDGHGYGPKEGKGDKTKTPAGWNKGKKTGWHGESLPPGLAKAKDKKSKD